MSSTSKRCSPALLLVIASIAFAAPASAQLSVFETPGITLGDDAVECLDQGSHRSCRSDAGSERILSHDGLPAGDRIPLDFELLLPPAPASGPDGNYPLVVFLHAWGGDRSAMGGGLESELVPYAEAGYAVLAYSARAWGESCGPSQRAQLECQGQWTHLADARYEVRDTQYIAGLLADEISDTGTPLVDPTRIGVVGVSYGGGQAATLATLRNRVIEPNGTLVPWTSPSGQPLEIAAAAPIWAWTDLAEGLMPNGRGAGESGSPVGVLKASQVAELHRMGLIGTVFAPPGEEPDIHRWLAVVAAGEPYLPETAGSVVAELSAFRSALHLLDEEVAPAPTLFHAGWSDALFPVDQALRWIDKAREFHPEANAQVFASDFGHSRARLLDRNVALASVREWFDHHLKAIGPSPGPAARAKIQDCSGTGSPIYEAATWETLSKSAVGATTDPLSALLSTAAPSADAALAFDPVTGGDPCARVPGDPTVGGFTYDLPAPDPGGYTILGTVVVGAHLSVIGPPPEQAMVVARLLDVDPNGRAQLLAEAVYRPEPSGEQSFALSPVGHHVQDTHHLQLQLLGQAGPTYRPSNFPFVIDLTNVPTIDVTFVTLHIPVAEGPDGGQLGSP